MAPMYSSRENNVFSDINNKNNKEKGVKRRVAREGEDEVVH
jgi:hypothetical protein